MGGLCSHSDNGINDWQMAFARHGRRLTIIRAGFSRVVSFWLASGTSELLL